MTRAEAIERIIKRVTEVNKCYMCTVDGYETFADWCVLFDYKSEGISMTGREKKECRVANKLRAQGKTRKEDCEFWKEVDVPAIIYSEDVKKLAHAIDKLIKADRDDVLDEAKLYFTSNKCVDYQIHEPKAKYDQYKLSEWIEKEIEKMKEEK